jgi:hypothetical protein
MANLLLMVIPGGVLIKEIEKILDVAQAFFLLFDRKE